MAKAKRNALAQLVSDPGGFYAPKKIRNRKKYTRKQKHANKEG